MNRLAGMVLCMVLAAGIAMALWGCEDIGRHHRPKADAVAVLMATEGSTVGGTVTFTQVQGGVRVIADIQGLPPGPHAIHIHEFGDCRAGDGSLAGGHFNPLDQPHAAPDAQARHMGDMGNVTAQAEGTVILDTVNDLLTLEGEHAIIGRSVVVHANADDFATQPHGAAGPRLACGTIGIARH